MSDNKHKIIIAIDGFSSCGKSTFAKAIARELGYIFIDTGAMYRAVTLYALEHGAIRSGIVDEDAVVRLLDQIAITFRFNPERGASDIYVNGDLVEGKIRTIEVSNCVSRVSAIAAVRRKLVAMQQEMGRRRGVVMDGDKAEHLLEAIPAAMTSCAPRETRCRSRRSNATCANATRPIWGVRYRRSGRPKTPSYSTTAA